MIANKIIGKTVTVKISRSLGSINHEQPSIHQWLNYGYVEGTATYDNEFQNAYVIGSDCPLTSFTGKVIAIIHRNDDSIDDKWVVAREGIYYSDQYILKATQLEGQSFGIEIIR